MSLGQADAYMREADRLTKKATIIYMQHGLDPDQIIERLTIMKDVWDREEDKENG